jgi:protein tyrosine/serine phosphatase
MFRITRAILLALLVPMSAEVARITVGDNFHTVVPGRCYRSAQPSTDDLRLLAREFGIRTVINLRGFDEREWYAEEKQTAQELGIAFVDAGMWASAPPPPDEFRQIVQALDESPEPILIHCESGMDRSGLASAIYLLLRTDTPMEQAHRQLSLRFGHYARGHAGCLDRVLAGYADWLAGQNVSHTPDRFRRWALEVYR